MSRIYPIASGSSGNCTYIGHGKSGLLVDAGVSALSISKALASAAIQPESIKGILITHSHIDHVAGLRVFANKYSLPVFMTEKTAEYLNEKPELNPKNIHIIEKKQFSVGDFEISNFPTSHDCPGSCGYTITFSDQIKCGVCTDLGIVTPEVHEALTGCTALLLESNHDVTLLQKGSYPEPLKKRILSDAGHLSNIACAKELQRLIDGGTTRIILGHLSRENNRPEIARTTVTSALVDHKMYENQDYTLYIAPPKDAKVTVF